MKKIVTALVVVTAALTLSACDTTGKYGQQYQDAKVDGVNKDAAQEITFPDGFSNAATKCDNGNRVYVLFHGDSAYGGIAVVPNDPTCAEG